MSRYTDNKIFSKMYLIMISSHLQGLAQVFLEQTIFSVKELQSNSLLGWSRMQSPILHFQYLELRKVLIEKLHP